MTDAVKQWIEKTSYKETGNPRNKLFYSMGLTKGIEISVGFAAYLNNGWESLDNKDRWKQKGARSNVFTNSQLLEKYLEHLSSINKEKS